MTLSTLGFGVAIAARRSSMARRRCMGTRWRLRLLPLTLCLSIVAGVTGCSSSPDAVDSLHTAQTATTGAIHEAYVAQYLSQPHGAPSVVQTYLQKPPNIYVTRYFVPSTHYLQLTETRNGHTTLCTADQNVSQCLPGATVSSVTTGPLSPTFALGQLRQANGHVSAGDVTSAIFAGQSSTCFTYIAPPAIGTSASRVTKGDPKVCVTADGVPAELSDLQGGGLTLSRFTAGVSATALTQAIALPPTSPPDG